jgi:integrase/recombinase XerD
MNRVSMVVRVVVDGKRSNLSPEEAKRRDLTGTFYLRWYENGKEKWQSVGKDSTSAQMALLRKEREFRCVVAGITPPKDVTLVDAIEAELHERQAKHDPNSVKRVRKELYNFAAVIKKQYLSEVTRGDIFVYWNWLKDAKKSAPRTIYNRVQTLMTFLKNRGVTGLLKTNEMPEYDEKDVDYYTENNPQELKRFFAACDPEERLAFMFFLHTGCREREVMFACWDDLDFVGKTLTVRPKPDLGFSTKNGKVRLVPIAQVLIDGLKTYVLTIPSRRLIFVNTEGGPEGHFLVKCKEIALRAGLNCGHCVSKKGLSCTTHAVCSKWTLHKFRRTWATMHLLSGMPITLLQNYIGHSDLETLNRYLARISAKTETAKQMAENMAKMVAMQGSVAADVMAEAVEV